MSLLDLIAIAIILILAIRGIRRGFVGEAIETIGAVGAAYLTYKFYPTVAGIFKLPTTGSVFLMIGGFIAAFLIVFVGMSIVGFLIRGLMRKIKLGPIDKVLGFALGFIKGAIVVVAISGGLHWIGGEPRALVEKSTVARTLLSVAESISPLDKIESPNKSAAPQSSSGE